MTIDQIRACPPSDWAHLPRSAGDPLYGDFAFGEFVRTAAIGDLQLDVTIHPAEMMMGEHAHPSLLLLFVLDGEIEETSQGRMSIGGPGTLLVRPAGTAHAVRALRRSRLFSIEAGPLWLERVGAGTLAGLLESSECTERLSSLALRVYTAFAVLDSGPAAALALQGYLQALLAELIQPTEWPEVPLWLRDTRHYLDAHLRDRLHLGFLAARAGVHPVHLSRSFRRHFGVTMTDYIREGRLAGAMLRLSTTDDPVARIAREAGYADQSHFTRDFRRMIGESPASYRGSLRGRGSAASLDHAG